MSKLEQLQKDVEDAEAAFSHVYEEWKDDAFHLDAYAVAIEVAKKALSDYLKEKG